jgi:hypothetical protein
MANGASSCSTDCSVDWIAEILHGLWSRYKNLGYTHPISNLIRIWRKEIRLFLKTRWLPWQDLALWRNGTYNRARGSLGSFLTILTGSRAIDKLRARGTNVKFLQRWSQMIATETSLPTLFESVFLSQRSHYVRYAFTQSEKWIRQPLPLEVSSWHQVNPKLF